MGCVAEIVYGTIECDGNCDNCYWWDEPQEGENECIKIEPSREELLKL